MSYSEIRQEIENEGYKAVFETLFYERATVLSNLELAKQQLKIAESQVESSTSNFSHFMQILYKDGIIQESDNCLSVIHIKDNIVWEAYFKIKYGEIICKTKEITSFDNAPDQTRV